MFLNYAYTTRYKVLMPTDVHIYRLNFQMSKLSANKATVSTICKYPYFNVTDAVLLKQTHLPEQEYGSDGVCPGQV